MQETQLEASDGGPLVSANLPGIGNAAGPALKLVSIEEGRALQQSPQAPFLPRVSQRKVGYCDGIEKGRPCHQGALRGKVSKLHKIGGWSWLVLAGPGWSRAFAMPQLKRTKGNKTTIAVFLPCTLTWLASASAVFLPCALTWLASASTVFKPTKHISLPKVTRGPLFPFSREESLGCDH